MWRDLHCYSNSGTWSIHRVCISPAPWEHPSQSLSHQRHRDWVVRVFIKRVHWTRMIHKSFKELFFLLLLSQTVHLLWIFVEIPFFTISWKEKVKSESGYAAVVLHTELINVSTDSWSYITILQWMRTRMWHVVSLLTVLCQAAIPPSAYCSHQQGNALFVTIEQKATQQQLFLQVPSS